MYDAFRRGDEAGTYLIRVFIEQGSRHQALDTHRETALHGGSVLPFVEDFDLTCVRNVKLAPGHIQTTSFGVHLLVNRRLELQAVPAVNCRRSLATARSRTRVAWTNGSTNYCSSRCCRGRAIARHGSRERAGAPYSFAHKMQQPRLCCAGFHTPRLGS